MKCGKCGSKVHLSDSSCFICGESRDGIRGYVPDDQEISLPKAPDVWNPSRLMKKEELPKNGEGLEGFFDLALLSLDPDARLPLDPLECEESPENTGTCDNCKREDLRLQGVIVGGKPMRLCSTCRIAASGKTGDAKVKALEKAAERLQGKGKYPKPNPERKASAHKKEKTAEDC